MKKDITVKTLEAVFAGRRPGIQGARGEYAVLVPLVEHEGGLQMLFELRAATMGAQPSETCFPGGRVEPGESPRQAALRETFEEIGIPPESVHVIAPLDIIQDISNRVIYPFLACLPTDAMERLKLNQSEVQEVFLVPLSYLRENPPYIYTSPVVMQVGEDFPYEKIGFAEGYTWRSGMVDVPVYEYEGHRVWGLTGRTVRQLLEILEQETG